MILDGIMILWFAEVLLSVVFVAVDVRRTPESPVMKWGFVIVTLYTGPIGAFLYVLACREPLPGTHAEYVRPRWRQVVGSTMHCVAGDGIGILAAAALLSQTGAPEWVKFLAEYALGFAFGWTVFQSLFMRGMAGGSYTRSLRMTLLPEFVSMNGVMAGMVALSVPWRQALGDADTPASPRFWFVMALSLTLGFAVTYPLNWWLVSAGLKHGMTTVERKGGERTAEPCMPGSMGRPDPSPAPEGGTAPATGEREEMPGMDTAGHQRATAGTRLAMVAVSLVVLAAGVAVAAGISSAIPA